MTESRLEGAAADAGEMSKGLEVFMDSRGLKCLRLCPKNLAPARSGERFQQHEMAVRGCGLQIRHREDGGTLPAGTPDDVDGQFRQPVKAEIRSTSMEAESIRFPGTLWPYLA